MNVKKNKWRAKSVRYRFENIRGKGAWVALGWCVSPTGHKTYLSLTVVLPGCLWYNLEMRFYGYVRLGSLGVSVSSALRRGGVTHTRSFQARGRAPFMSPTPRLHLGHIFANPHPQHAPTLSMAASFPGPHCAYLWRHRGPHAVAVRAKRSLLISVSLLLSYFAASVFFYTHWWWTCFFFSVHDFIVCIHLGFSLRVGLESPSRFSTGGSRFWAVSLSCRLCG